MTTDSTTESALSEQQARSASDADSIDRQCMNRLAAGDQAAMHELVNRYGEMLSRLIGRLTAWRDGHEDLLQDVLVLVWERASNYRAEGSLEGWLRRIAVNRCRNHFRSRDAVRRLIESFTFNSDRTDAQPNREVEAFETTEWTRAALQKLNQQDRTVLVLFYLEELSGEEVAAMTGVKPETVHVQLHRARKRLRTILESDPHDDT